MKMPHTTQSIFLFLGLMVSVGCSTEQDDQSEQDGSIDDGSSTVDSSSEGGEDDDAGYTIDYHCDDDCPSRMIIIPGQCACIDAYEYSNSNYSVFLNENGENTCNDYLCRLMGVESTYITNLYEFVHEGEQMEYIIDEAIKETDGGVFKVTEGLEDFPVGLVTWYGANMACRWEGKRLCPREVWYAACSHGGEWHYPYGGTTGGVDSASGFYQDYIPGNCNTGGGYSPAQVGTFIDCEGGYPDIYDMAGNNEEWVDVSSSGEYVLVGGSYDTNTAEDGEPDNGAGCRFNGINIIAENGDIPANRIDYDSGFRCCVIGKP